MHNNITNQRFLNEMKYYRLYIIQDYLIITYKQKLLYCLSCIGIVRFFK